MSYRRLAEARAGTQRPFCSRNDSPPGVIFPSKSQDIMQCEISSNLAQKRRICFPGTAFLQRNLIAGTKFAES